MARSTAFVSSNVLRIIDSRVVFFAYLYITRLTDVCFVKSRALAVQQQQQQQQQQLSFLEELLPTARVFSRVWSGTREHLEPRFYERRCNDIPDLKSTI